AMPRPIHPLFGPLAAASLLRLRAGTTRVVRGLLVLALVAGCGAEVPGPTNAVLVSVDTLRADRLGAYGYGAARTPELDALSDRSIRFERAYAHSSMTLPSIATLLTGRLPAEHGVEKNGIRLNDRWPTLATRLREAGFATAGFIGNFTLRPANNLSRGFDRYTRDYGGRESNRGTPENLGATLNEQAIAWLDARDRSRPFFLWIHYQEPHGPYTPSSYDEVAAAEPGVVLAQSPSQSGRGAIPRYQWLGHGRLSEYSARYDGEVSDVDLHLGRLVRALEERGLLEDTLLVFTADHGEAFGEENLYAAHGEGLGEALLRVPLLLRVPGVEPAVRRDVVRLLDVAPTVLELLRVEAPDLPGESLLRASGDRPVVAQVRSVGARWRSARDGDFRLVESKSGRMELTRLRGEASPEEEQRARDSLAALLERDAPWIAETTPTRPLTSAEREALQALGYLDGAADAPH
ncbi:MAG: sulfatase, partial [Deltaproteobacteria bacterium]